MSSHHTSAKAGSKDRGKAIDVALARANAEAASASHQGAHAIGDEALLASRGDALRGRLGNRALGALLQGALVQGGASARMRTLPRDEHEAERAADAQAQIALQPRSPAAAVSVRARPALAEVAVPAQTPDHVRAVISARSENLQQGLAEEMGQAFDLDLGGVAIHRDAGAARSAALLGAQAYTLGRHVVFGHDRYAPHSPGGRALIAHELAHVTQQQHGTPRVQCKKGDAPKITYLEVAAEGFDEAALNFAAMLAQKVKLAKARIVIVNGPNVKIYDEAGKPVVKKFFHLTAPSSLPIGVYGRANAGRALHAVGVRPDGGWFDAGAVVIQGGIDFSKNIDDQEAFDAALNVGAPTYYVSPSSTAAPPTADAPPPVPIENLPEFMEFEAKTKANLPAWPSATLPLTSQIATVNSSGTFICRVDKNQGSNTLDRVTNLMQPTSFRWEVLKLDEKLRVTGKKKTSGWDAAVEGFARRKRQLADDKAAMLGDRRRQSIPESIFRAAIYEQTKTARESLAMVGQTVMTVINAITGGPNQLTTEDVMDVPFKQQGDYFVRCLATQVVPKDAKYRRATSVSGVMVSVYDIQDVARDALSSGDALKADAEKSVAEVQAELDQLDEDIENGVGDVVIKRSERAYRALTLDYFKDLAAAGGNPLNAKVAEQNLLKSQIAYFDSDDYPQEEKYRAFKDAKLEQLRKRLKVVDAEVARMRGALSERDSQIEPVGYMRAVLVDEVTSAKTPLVFAVGERRYIAADNLEVVIADVTGAKGRTFSASASGALGAGRQDAWLDAMTDLRRNLNRGRGWISYEVPPSYQRWKDELPNPMKLEMSASAQVKETIDDAAHALTIGAILAAPFTGGASLSILAVLAPIQAASSLYNIVNRAAYSDLELDQEAVFDLINVATLGLGKLSTVGKAGSRGLAIVASSSRIAIKLINGGQFLVISYETFNALMEEGDPNGDPRELRRKKLLKLLSWFEQAAIPVSEKLFSEAHGPAARKDKTSEGKDARLNFEEPTQAKPAARKPTVKEGALVEPGAKPTEHGTAVEGGAPGAAQPAVFKPSKTQMRGVPESLQGKVAVVEGMGKDARVVYKRAKNGLITDVQIQIGEKASAADVKTHAAVAELILKYSGVGGRMRRLLGRFIDLFAGPEAKRPEIGSRAWEAKFELVKLDRMMRERHAELATIADQPAAQRDLARQKELMSDLDSLELQYQEHAEVFNAIEMGTAQGRGYIAAEGMAEGERVRIARKLPEAPSGYRWRFRKGRLEVVGDPDRKKLVYDEAKGKFVADTGARVPDRFDSGIDKRKAFRDLGGYDPDTSFGGFVKLLLEQGLIKSREDVIKAMGEPGGRTHDTVRGNVKDVFKTKLIAQITSTAYLKQTARYKEVLRRSGDATQARRAAGMEEMLRLSERLGPEERGVLGERVYAELFGGKQGVAHVDVSPAELAAAKGIAESEVPLGRSIDRMDGTRARELKNVSTRLGPRERGQIDDMLAMVGSKVQPSSGAPRTIEQVSVAFLDPKGGVANASLAYEILSANPKAPLTFEFHTADGKVLKVTAKNMSILQEPGFAAKLGVPGK